LPKEWFQIRLAPKEALWCGKKISSRSPILRHKH
jgi:hypothetical protein